MVRAFLPTRRTGPRLQLRAPSQRVSWHAYPASLGTAGRRSQDCLAAATVAASHFSARFSFQRPRSSGSPNTVTTRCSR
eukprot:1933610-Prymnesium_polylepis.1